MGISYSYNEQSASHADDVANRIDENGPYVGKFSRVWAFEKESGSEGVHFEFETANGAKQSFDIYTVAGDAKDNAPIERGQNQINAIMGVLGVKNMESTRGTIEVFEDGKRVESQGECFPQLCNKSIGLVFQREKYTRNDKTDGVRMNMYAIFHAESKLMVSEMREGKSYDPEKGKLAKVLRGLKDKDSRTQQAAEPVQPALGGGEGGY